MADTEKLVFMATHGSDHAEHATIPFVMAAAAPADAVELVKSGVPETVNAEGFPPLAKLLADVRELDGQLLVCSPCLKSRGIVAPDDLVDGTEVVATGRFVAEITSATNSLVYQEKHP